MKNKKIYVVICMFMILILIVIAPMFFHQMNDEKILNHLYVEDLVYETRKIEKSDLSLEEKMNLLISYGEDNQIVSSSHKETLNDDNDDNQAMLNSSLIDELKTLKRLKIIPDIEIKNTLEYRSFITKIYSDVSHPGRHVSLWNIRFMNGDYYMEAWIDSESKKIYQLIIEGAIPQSAHKDALNIFCNQYLQVNLKNNEDFFTLSYKENIVMGIFFNSSI